MISSIIIKNFRIYKDQLLNFPKNGMILIAGPNGSGKSSIGMAIGLALNLEGFHKYRSEKGFTINDLIKEEEDESLIILQIENKSLVGKKLFPFSDSIIKLERKLDRYQTATNLKITADGKNYSTYKQFYENANFQPSSSFLYIPQGKLGDLIPTKRAGVNQINYFDEFIKYVALTEDQVLQEAYESYQKAKATLETFTKNHFYPAEDEVNKLEEQFKKYKAFIIKKDSELSSAMLLNSVLHLHTEKKIKELLDEKKILEETFKQMESELNHKSEKLNALKLDSLRQSIEDIKENISQLDVCIQPVAIELKGIETALTNKLERLEELESALEEEELDLKNQKELIREAQKQAEKTDSKNQESTLKLLKERRQQLINFTKEKSEIVVKFNDKITGLSDQKQNYMLEKKKFGKDKTDLISNLGSLLTKSKDENKIDNFPKHIKNLQQIIKEKGLEVIGPAGLYIAVKDHKHVSLVEIALGANFLFGFCTKDLEDQRLLDRIIIQNRIENVNVYYFDSQKRPSPVTSYPKSSIPTFSGVIGRIIDLIEIKHSIIDLMIKEFPARNWIACSSIQAAEKVCLNFKKTGLVGQPKNSALVKRPLRSSNGMSTVFRSTKLQVLSGFDFTEEITQVQKDIRDIDDRLKSLDEHIQKIDKEISSYKESMNKKRNFLEIKEENTRKNIIELEALLGDTNLSIALIEQKITGLQEEISKNKENIAKEAKIVREMKIQLQNTKNKNIKLVNQRNEKKQLLNNYSLELTEKEEEEKELKTQIVEIKDKINNSKIEHEDIELAQKEFLVEIENEAKQTNYYKQKIHECIQIIEDQLKDLRQNKSKSSWIDIFEAENQAFDGSLRLLKDKKRLESLRIDKLEQDYYLAKATQDIELEDVIIDRYDYARELLQEQKARKELLEIENNLRDSEYGNAYQKWYEIVDKELIKLKKKFQKLIGEVKGRGHIEVRNLSGQRDDKRPIMNLKASFHKNTAPRSVTSHLHSGGESTLLLLAYILSLQSLRPQPIYFFDEPDAHLDPVNRDRVFKMIKAASGESQYFVFSPQDFEEKHEVPDSVFYVFKSEDENIVVKEIT